MNETAILNAYQYARERYAALGVDTDKAVEILENTPISLHCWQTDDVIGFERDTGLSGGIQTTGNYPGRARNIDEVRRDILFAKSLIAGHHRLNLHEIYGDFGGRFVDRDQVEVRHFESWIQWARENGMKLDFNSTSFGHPKSGDLSLASPDPAIRAFWIEHTKRCRRIADAMGRAQGAEDLPGMKTCLEAKLFGIGLESYTVGSHDFVAGYCATRKLMYTLDTGHYEMTENVSDMVASLLLFVPELMLHVSRPIRWDSDHVTIMNDQTLDLFKEIVRAGALDRSHIGLDYFDAAINRIGAYVIGTRATQKCLLSALLEPLDRLREYEDSGRGFQRLALLEEAKTLPFGAVFDYFNLKNNVPVGTAFIPEIERYEREVTAKR